MDVVDFFLRGVIMTFCLTMWCMEDLFFFFCSFLVLLGIDFVWVCWRCKEQYAGLIKVFHYAREKHQ